MDYSAILSLPSSERISVLKEKMLNEPRYVSIEQARIVTEVYHQTEGQPPCIRRARALQAALTRMSIRLEPEERIVGNRTPGVRAGVVFPETGASWVDREFETLSTRPQDRFQVRQADITEFRTKILPYWKGRSLEDQVCAEIGPEVDAIAKVAKINQKDHSQGHICPNTEKWLSLGPAGLRAQAATHLETARVRSCAAMPIWQSRWPPAATRRISVRSRASAASLLRLPPKRIRKPYRPRGSCMSFCRWRATPPRFLRDEWISICTPTTGSVAPAA